jgi:isopentenyldiphosphate isomerase
VSGAGGELIDVVDDAGRRLAVVTRAEMRARRLRHRAVYIVVLDSADRVVVHRRAAWKDVWPSAWDLAFGGVVAAGEPWLDAARRELGEEAGIGGVELQPLGEQFRYEDADVALVGRVFLARTDAAAVPVDGEVAEVATVARRDLASWACRRRLCPDSARCVLPLVAAIPDA